MPRQMAWLFAVGFALAVLSLLVVITAQLSSIEENSRSWEQTKLDVVELRSRVSNLEALSRGIIMRNEALSEAIRELADDDSGDGSDSGG